MREILEAETISFSAYKISGVKKVRSIIYKQNWQNWDRYLCKNILIDL
jgi:hypothetical protein